MAMILTWHLLFYNKFKSIIKNSNDASQNSGENDDHKEQNDAEVEEPKNFM